MTSGFRFLSFRKMLAFRKGIFVAIPLVILGGYAVHEAAGHAGGVVGDSKVGCGGGGCHGSKSTSTVVTISTGATQIVAGQTYTFQISVANPSEAGAGCDITADNAAKLAVSGSGLQVYNNELTHTSPRTFTGDSAVWTFKYTAPTKAGTAHIYAAGNAVNLNGNADNSDHWNTVTYVVNVVAPSGPEIVAPVIERDTALRGDTVTSTFWVKNTGTATLIIDRYAMKLGTAFSIADSAIHSIAVGDSAEVGFQFIARSGTSYKDTIFIYSNAVLAPVSSTGLFGLVTAGVFHVSANPANFGSVGIARPDTMTITISNTGNGLLSITPNSLTIANPDFTIISVSSSTPPYSISPKGTLIVNVSFTPSTAGSDTAIFPLTVSEYNGNTIDTSIVLVGEGTAAYADPSLPDNPSVSISHNPSQGIFNLSSSDMSGMADIEVTDLAGRIVARDKITLGSESEINLSALPSGTYFLAIKPSDGQRFQRRIVLQR